MQLHKSWIDPCAGLAVIPSLSRRYGVSSHSITRLFLERGSEALLNHENRVPLRVPFKVPLKGSIRATIRAIIRI